MSFPSNKTTKSFLKNRKVFKDHSIINHSIDKTRLKNKKLFFCKTDLNLLEKSKQKLKFSFYKFILQLNVKTKELDWEILE